MTRKPRSIQVDGKTVKEAIAKGLLILGVPKPKVKIEVLAEESKGLFEMRGAHPAQVRMTLKE